MRFFLGIFVKNVNMLRRVNLIKRIIFLALVMLILSICSAYADQVNLDHIARIESNFNARAYNRHSGARGMYQVTLVCLDDYNQFHKAKISKNELFLAARCREVADWYLNMRIPQLLRKYGKEVNISNQLWAYNAGIGRVVKGIKPVETKRYIKKYYKLERG